MANEENVLPAPIRATFERFGVIPAPTWPKLDRLTKALAARRARFSLSAGADGGATATVFIGARQFTGADAAPERALAKAFAEGLRETSPAQLALAAAGIERLGGDEESDDEADDADEDDQAEEMVWMAQHAAWIGKTTGMVVRPEEMGRPLSGEQA